MANRASDSWTHAYEAVNFDFDEPRISSPQFTTTTLRGRQEDEERAPMLGDSFKASTTTAATAAGRPAHMAVPGPPTPPKPPRRASGSSQTHMRMASSGSVADAQGERSGGVGGGLSSSPSAPSSTISTSFSSSTPLGPSTRPLSMSSLKSHDAPLPQLPSSSPSRSSQSATAVPPQPPTDVQRPPASFQTFALSSTTGSPPPQDAPSGPPFLVLTSKSKSTSPASFSSGSSRSTSLSDPLVVHRSASPPRNTQSSIVAAGDASHAQVRAAKAAPLGSLSASQNPSPASVPYAPPPSLPSMPSIPSVPSSSVSSAASGSTSLAPLIPLPGSSSSSFIPNHQGAAGQATPSSYPSSPFARPGSRPNSMHIQRIASEESRVLAAGNPSNASSSMRGDPRGEPPINMQHMQPSTTHGTLSSHGSRGSMILYHIAVAEDGSVLAPPGLPQNSQQQQQNQPVSVRSVRSFGGLGFVAGGGGNNRKSTYSMSGDSIVSMAGDSKYPVGMGAMFSGNSLPRSGYATPSSPLGPNHHNAMLPSTPSSSHFLGPSAHSPFLASAFSTPPLPMATPPLHGGLIPYAYDPEEDASSDEDEGDWLHDPDIEPCDHDIGWAIRNSARGDVKVHPHPQQLNPAHGKIPASLSDPSTKSSLRKSLSSTSKAPAPSSVSAPASQVPLQGGTYKGSPLPPYREPGLSSRGLINVSGLVALVLGLMALFLVYPVVKAFSDDGVTARIIGNTRINSTGQAVEDIVLGARDGVEDGGMFVRDFEFLGGRGR